MRAGYAVVPLNLPGYAGSGGRATIMSDDQGAVFYLPAGFADSKSDLQLAGLRG